MKDIHDKIERALKDSIAYHNDGTSADEAIAKSASAHELNPETVNRVVEAFNIAKTRAFIKKASKRDDDFDTADKSNVQKLVFGSSGEKKAALLEDVLVTHNSSSYKMSFSRPEEKTASSILEEAVLPIEDYSLATNSAKRAMDQEREKVAEYSEQFYRALSKTVACLDYLYEDEKHAALDECAYEYNGEQNFDYCIQALNKVANIGYKKPTTVKSVRSHNTTIVSAIGDMMVAVDQYKTAASTLSDSMKEFADGVYFMDSVLQKSAGVNTSEDAAAFLFKGSAISTPAKLHGPAEDVFDELFGIKKAASQVVNKTAASLLGIGTLKKTAASTDMGVDIGLGNIPIVESLVNSSDERIKDLESKGYLARKGLDGDSAEKDELDQELAGMRGKAILQDLMANDEIISQIAQESPESIVQTYNTMAKLAPKASQMKELVRSTLRYATAQSIDPNYAAQLIDLENKLEARSKGVVKLKG